LEKVFWILFGLKIKAKQNFLIFSFGLLKEGFESMLPIELFPKGYELVTVNDSCAIGAAIVAAKNNLKMDIPYNPNSHCQSIYSRKN